MSERFRDDRETVFAFTDTTYVECPSCGACARSQISPGEVTARQHAIFAPRRLACTACGYSANWNSTKILRDWRAAQDDYFGLPLWLQSPCCGDVLWAYNERHLELIEGIVDAKLRERVRDEEYGWANQSLMSRLPGWIKSAKHRDDVLKTIAKLRKDRPIPSP